ncbi:MAG: phytanoyl-CoA dioxygenase family protein [Acidimicrobiia bacterium]|nr:phytanoyl-CoA dioxygenase family protein [Acidimicrobiia bacterium]
MNDGQRRQLDELGFVKREAVLDAPRTAALVDTVEELFAAEGLQAGSEFRLEPGSRRLANVAAKGEIFRQCVEMPEILVYVEHVLGAEYKLSSLNVRSANPHNHLPQPLHADAGALPDKRGYWICNTVWLLDDFTEENGAIRFVPGSHQWGKLPQDVLADPAAPHPDEILVTGKAGDVVIMNTHGWHGGTENRTGSHRRAMHIFFCRRDKPQQQYQKRLIPAEVQQGLSPRLRWLLALDDPLNDQLSATGAGASGFLK